jgi:hypothetical protein
LFHSPSVYFCPTLSGSLPVYRRVGKYVGKYASGRGAIVRRYFNEAVQ